MWTGLTFDLHEEDGYVARDVLILNDGPWENPDVHHDTLVWSHGVRMFRNVHG